MAKIDQAEWDFRYCPMYQLRFCVVYEYARESNAAKRQVTAWREMGSWPESLAFENANWMKGYPRIKFLERFQEFPHTPWLKIPGTKRQREIARCPEYDPPVAIAGFDDPVGEDGRPDQLQLRWTEPRGRYSILSLKINWSYSDEQLASKFKYLIQMNRDRIGYPADERHAPTSDQDYLKKLAAKRLLAAFGGDAKAAANHTKNYFKVSENDSGTPLYAAHRHVWERAAEQATALLEGGPYPSMPVRAREILERIDYEQWPVRERDRIFTFLTWANDQMLTDLCALETPQLIRLIEKEIGRRP